MISYICIILAVCILFRKPTVVIVKDAAIDDTEKTEKYEKSIRKTYSILLLIVIILTITFAYKFWTINI